MFWKGDKVEMTPKAIEQGFNGRLNRRTGVVTKYQFDMVWVKRRNEKYGSAYHKSYWRLEKEGNKNEIYRH